MFHKVDDPNFITGEHDMLRFWAEHDVFGKLEAQNADKPHWSFLDGPITANNPMGVHHAWGRTYKDAFQRYRAMTGRKLRYQNGFDCQGLWVEVEVEKELNLGTKTGIADYGIDRFVRECKKRVLNFAARQTEQSVRLGYWMEWDDPGELRKLADAIGEASRETSDESPEKGSQKESLNSQLSTLDSPLTYTTARGQTVTAPAEQIAAKLGNPEWGGSYFTFSTENNETIWSFLKKCFERKKIYMGHDVMPWSGRAGSAYSQMEVADGRNLTTHRSCFVRFKLITPQASREASAPGSSAASAPGDAPLAEEYLLVWTTTPWTLTSQRRLRRQPGPGVRQAPREKGRRRLLLRQGQPGIQAAGKGVQGRLRPARMVVARRRRQAQNDRAALQGTGRVRDRRDDQGRRHGRLAL